VEEEEMLSHVDRNLKKGKVEEEEMLSHVDRNLKKG
jgi:hypothetical protein